MKTIPSPFRKMIRENIRKSREYYEDFFLDLGLIEGSIDYVRFIILGRSRVGSNFLRGLLNAHSQIITFSELFQDYQYIDWGFPDYPQSKRILSLYQRNPSDFLENKIYRKYPAPISAIGFKIFYYHAQDDSRKSVWKYLQAEKDLKVIHIKRNNVLRTYLSRKKAEMTDAWADISGTKKNYHPVHLGYDECLANFIRTRKWEKQYDLFFENQEKLDLIYEDLAKDYDSEMKRIWNFFGLRYEKVNPVTYKQSTEPLSKAISNYLELKQKFVGTPWEGFFED